jgi:hypothetical protein
MKSLMRYLERATVLLLCLSMAAAGLGPIAAPPEESGTSGAVRGTLIDSNGQPLVGYRVQVRDNATGAVRKSAPTGPDGKFEIPDVPPGSYTYEMFDPDGRLIPVRIEPILVEAGTVLTQPIAIVPSKKGKDKLVAFLVGGGVLLTAIIVINNNDDDDDGGKIPSLTKMAP